MENLRNPSRRSQLQFSWIRTQLLPWVLLKTKLVINLNIYLIWGKENKLLIVSAATRIARDLHAIMVKGVATSKLLLG